MAVTPTLVAGLLQGKVVKTTYDWTVDNFSSCSKRTSPTFTKNDNTFLKWRIVAMHPNGVSSSKYLALILILESCVSDVCVKCTFSLLNIEMEQENMTTTEKMFYRFQPNNYLAFPKFIPRQRLLDEANNLLPGDKLTVHCEIEVNEIVPIKAPTLSVLGTLEKVFHDKSFSDVTLVADGKEIRAHKCILMARSPEFAAKFQLKTEEQESNHVPIDNIAYDVLTEMLRFMYTDRAPNLDKMADGLLAAADKYGLDSLKELCEEVLYKKISVETAAETLVLSDLHTAECLKARTIAFINTPLHATEVMATAGWQNMIREHPHLVAEVLQAFAVQQEQHFYLCPSNE